MNYVLVVEDEEMTRKLIFQIVKSLGYTPITASNGKRGLQILEDNLQIKAVLTDYQMPEMDGREFITAVKSNEKLKDVSILVFSAYIKMSEINSLFEIGAEAFLNKPISKKDIQEYLGRLFDK